MDLRQLEYFVAIADAGTFQAAARRLHMTQPPLSTQIRLLEEEVGTPLFLRGPRQVTLTGAGKLLYSRASTLLELQKNTVQELLDYTEGNKGVLRFGIASSANGELLTRMILPFSRKYPGIRFELTESNTYRLLELLEANLLDVALTRTPFQAQKNFEVQELFEDCIVAVGGSRFFPDKNTKKSTGISLSMLSSYPLIIYRRWKSVLDHAFSELGLSPDYFCIADDARTCLSWADAGLGIAIVPQSAVSFSGMELQEVPVTQPSITSSLCLVTRKGSYIPAALQLFLREIQAIYPGVQDSESSSPSSQSSSS